MEVKINKEIYDYKEKIFFGLTLRQFIFSVIACIVAVLLYFLLRKFIGLEVLSWICILGAIPFAFLGFFRYHGMYAEEFIIVWIRSEILMPKVLLFKPENFYDELEKNEIKRLEKEMMNGVVYKQKQRKRKSKRAKVSTTGNTD